jgi:hypothetical protein
MGIVTRNRKRLCLDADTQARNIFFYNDQLLMVCPLSVSACVLAPCLHQLSAFRGQQAPPCPVVSEV